MRKLLLCIFIFILSTISFAQPKVKVLYTKPIGCVFWSSIAEKIEKNINEFLLNNDIDIKNIDIEKTDDDVYLIIITYEDYNER